MEAIRKWLTPKNKKRSNRKHPAINSSVSGSVERLADKPTLEVGQYDPRGAGHVGIAANFAPRVRGRDETLAWLAGDSPDALADLLTVRGRAARQVRRGPSTKGTREIKHMLREPSRKAVEQFHIVRSQAEMAVRYGVPGTVAYNFSKSVRWNTTAAPRLPLLRLENFGSMVREAIGTSCTPSPPIDWLVLRSPTPQAAHPGEWPVTHVVETECPETRRSVVQDSEEDVVQEGQELMPLDTEMADAERGDDPYDDAPDVSDCESVAEEWEAREAHIMAVTVVPAQMVRTIDVKPRRQRAVDQGPVVAELSSPDSGVVAEK
ncbi:Uu.00g128050.m01.CDS01 [Anthostomella pinea]|uniref:Uu.00g128050.m01.CDS01 n=1 Tax=Anthostomella pinea TaxID=933095 RepID=A0AAI8VIZ2_9PEZI|nr:Uu.00g128050.m01.CDS01 [Anthostomella pinea]